MNSLQANRVPGAEWPGSFRSAESLDSMLLSFGHSAAARNCAVMTKSGKTVK
jgi:hypothetical protein